jgi:hypothetical protein
VGARPAYERTVGPAPVIKNIEMHSEKKGLST